jgi:hypothetical protein
MKTWNRIIHIDRGWYHMDRGVNTSSLPVAVSRGSFHHDIRYCKDATVYMHCIHRPWMTERRSLMKVMMSMLSCDSCVYDFVFIAYITLITATLRWNRATS